MKSVSCDKPNKQNPKRSQHDITETFQEFVQHVTQNEFTNLIQKRLGF